VAQWDHVRYWTGDGDLSMNTFQAIIFSDGGVLLSYMDMSPNDLSWSDESIGFEDQAGSDGVQISLGEIPASGTTYFVPPVCTEGCTSVSCMSVAAGPYYAGSPIDVTFTEAASTTDWIGIYNVGDTPGTHGSHDWVYHHGTTSGGDLVITGTVQVTAASAGEFFIVMFENDGYTEVTERVFITVEPAEECACVFPFTYSGVTYDECTDVADTQTWCATSVDADGAYEGNWIYCAGICSGDTSGAGQIAGCVFGVGDGVGGTETLVGTAANEFACVTMVMDAEPTANGATFNGDALTEGSCYAEIGMTGRNDNAGWNTCILVPDICEYVAGDGVGGTESYVGSAASEVECVNMVLAFSDVYSTNGLTPNGATYPTDGGDACYAEFGMTGVDDYAGWQTCQLPSEVGICEFQMGDGVGGSETGVGDAANVMDCVHIVLTTQPDANGATYSNSGGQGCYAEFGMTGANGSDGWQTCMFPGAGDEVGGGITACIFGVGDGVGGSEESVGTAANEAVCVSMVVAAFPEANGATFNGAATTEGSCYAEIGMTGRNDSTGWNTCIIVPDICTYIVGDGVGGTETGVGDAATRSECVNMVLSMAPKANGATYSTTGGTACYAEFGMTGENDSASWQTCQLPSEIGGCEFFIGDGVGGTETGVGDAANVMDCVHIVITTQPDANGVTYSNSGGQGCYAEFGMTGANGSDGWQTCMLPAPFVPASVNACIFGVGDGVGGSEESVGTAANEAVCVSMVMDAFPEANGATFNGDATTEGSCYAEIGMTGRNDSTGWNTCIIVPDICEYVVGDGVGGTESYLGSANGRGECVNMVLSMEPTANGVTYPTGTADSGACYAEFGMTGPNDSTSWQTCQLPSDIGRCEFLIGDGVGGTETGVGNAANVMECVHLVISTQPDANGVTYSNSGGQGCYAEFGMTGANGSDGWQTCMLI
jgi:hypothetical protein